MLSSPEGPTEPSPSIYRAVTGDSAHLVLRNPEICPQRTTNPKILRRLERILLRGILCALRVLAVNAGQHFHREDAKDAKKTLRRLAWFRAGRAVFIRYIR